ncbi:serine/arginine repetitive matrix protein 1-like isoform X2 [Pseudomyrmex gracilis]|uniref:serine/arginine repetitive matrix protein 1-like isoform X2 n=1 Tax=Pseudomyrmex gracilis TaxID=219809 RepID=UPI000995986D|nr:serine/arginine repetitive matrix protein 1-like isoform X2 [Pseudomyrmex gracilis]
MDRRQKPKIKIEEEDDDDVEKLRLAALKTMGMGTKKDTSQKKLVVLQMQKVLPQTTHSCFPRYKNQRPTKKNMYYNRAQQRQNGNVYYPSPRNPNLIAIVPVDEPSPLQQAQPMYPIEQAESYPQDQETSKFCRFKDNGSASEEEDTKEAKTIITSSKTESSVADEKQQEFLEQIRQEESTENLQKNGDDQKEEDSNNDDDDDDIILMADLEEEDSLERLMDEMEKEMNDGNKSSEKREKKLSKNENKETIKSDEGNKILDQRTTRSDESLVKKERNNTSISSLLITSGKNDRRSISPHVTNRGGQKRKSLSPRSRSRKKSPRRSPRRSPIRQQKKSPRESTRYRSSPRRSPLSRYSPRPRLSPRPSPRRSPNRTKKSPLRKLSPRGRSPRFLSRSRSPRLHRSRSPRRSKSPRSCSPKISRSRSPSLRYSPLRSSKSKSPRPSPRRLSPRRLRSRSRSLGSSPRRDVSRLRSPKGSPRRTPPRGRSPHRSPWSSPKRSPSRLSPRRRRSPRWSPKELPRKQGSSSVNLDNRDGHARDSSPAFKDTAPLEISRVKTKQKDEVYERPSTTTTTTTTTTMTTTTSTTTTTTITTTITTTTPTTTATTTTEIAKESVDAINDPVREARKKKFESTRPIDLIHANKKIKLSKKVVTNTKAESSLETEVQLSGVRKAGSKSLEEYDVKETNVFSENAYEFEEFEGAENTSPSAVNTRIDIEPKKPMEKEKKKRKHDKELYQVGKLKNELPLSERIGKDKKCKKRKEMVSEENMEVFEDIAVEEEGDLRAELSRRRAERLNRTVPMQSARLLQSAFKGVVNEVVKNNAKANQRHVINTDDKSNQKEVRRVTVLHRSLPELHDSGDESTVDSKVPVRFRLGLNKQESRESKVTRKPSKRQGRKVKHKNHLSLKDPERIL